MMNSLIQEEFSLRQEDIDLIIELTEKLSKGNHIEIKNSNDESVDELDYTEKTINVLKSVVYLLAYNQTESTMRGCLEQVYDDIADNEVSYDELKSDIQTAILKGLLKKFDSGVTLKRSVQNQLSMNSPQASLEIRKVFNGNVEAQTIYDIRDTYSIPIHPRAEDRNGTDITALKKARNDLAHGNISFSEFGAEKPLQEVKDTIVRTSSYLESVIQGFDQYIADSGYKS